MTCPAFITLHDDNDGLVTWACEDASGRPHRVHYAGIAPLTWTEPAT